MSVTAKASDPPVAAKADLRSPDEWAAQQFPLSKNGRLPLEFAHHMTAAALHEWADHRTHAGAPKLLSAEDYAAALMAAQTPDKQGNYTPHGPALSDFSSRKTSAAKGTQQP